MDGEGNSFFIELRKKEEAGIMVELKKTEKINTIMPVYLILLGIQKDLKRLADGLEVVSPENKEYYIDLQAKCEKNIEEIYMNAQTIKGKIKVM
jgi:hypothetical protein